MAVYKEDGETAWKVLNDYTLNVVAEFETYDEAEKYAKDNGYNLIRIFPYEYHAAVD